MKRVGEVAVLAAGVVLLAGCVGDSGGASTTTVTKTAEPIPEESLAPEPSASSTTTVPWSLGEYAQNDYQKTRAIAVEQASSDYSQLAADQQWWKVEIETCALADLQGETVTTGWSPWGLQGDDGGSYPASNMTWSDFPKPQYPFGSDPIPVGQCRKGWVMIAMNQGVSASAVTYSPDGATGTTWTVE